MKTVIGVMLVIALLHGCSLNRTANVNDVRDIRSRAYNELTFYVEFKFKPSYVKRKFRYPPFILKYTCEKKQGTDYDVLISHKIIKDKKSADKSKNIDTNLYKKVGVDDNGQNKYELLDLSNVEDFRSLERVYIINKKSPSTWMAKLLHKYDVIESVYPHRIDTANLNSMIDYCKSEHKERYENIMQDKMLEIANKEYERRTAREKKARKIAKDKHARKISIGIIKQYGDSYIYKGRSNEVTNLQEGVGKINFYYLDLTDYVVKQQISKSKYMLQSKYSPVPIIITTLHNEQYFVGDRMNSSIMVSYHGVKLYTTVMGASGQYIAINKL